MRWRRIVTVVGNLPISIWWFMIKMLVPNGGHFELPEDWCVGDLPISGNGASVRTESLHHRQVRSNTLKPKVFVCICQFIVFKCYLWSSKEAQWRLKAKWTQDNWPLNSWPKMTLRRGAYRDFHTYPIHPLIAYEHLRLYIQKHFGVVTSNSKLEQKEFFQRMPLQDIGKLL